MALHKLITVVRQGGFAARCDEPGCGAITFGGFPSRTAAREALRGHENASEATASVNKKSPRGGNLEGSDS